MSKREFEVWCRAFYGIGKVKVLSKKLVELNINFRELENTGPWRHKGKEVLRLTLRPDLSKVRTICIDKDMQIVKDETISTEGYGEKPWNGPREGEPLPSLSVYDRDYN